LQPLRASALGVLALVALLAGFGCGSESEPVETTRSARASTTAKPAAAGAAASKECKDAFVRSHAGEDAGQPTNIVFLPSIQECSTLGEWTAAAKSLGVNLRGREPDFVEGVCAAHGPEVQSLVICQEATAALQLRASGS
jgi:hypothetical protein